MTIPRVQRTATSWVVEFVDATVTQCRVDYGFTLLIQDSLQYFELYIGRSFVASTSSTDTPFEVVVGEDPLDSAPGLALLHQPVLRSTILNDGSLELSLAEGGWVRVEVDDEYEAWTLSGPDNLRIVSGPGGVLTKWSPDSERAAEDLGRVPQGYTVQFG